MNQKHLEEFDRAWTLRYINLLSIKREILLEIIEVKKKGQKTEKLLDNLDTVNLELDLCMTEHSIFFGQLKTNDFMQNNSTSDINWYYSCMFV